MAGDLLVEMGSRGAAALLAASRHEFDAALAQRGAQAPLGFPGTNYFLPIANALLKIEVRTLGECAQIFEETEKLCANKPARNSLFIDALNGVLNKGIAALLMEEVLAALSYQSGSHPQPGCAGFLSDTLLRSLGVQLVDGRIAGIAVLLGPAKDDASAVTLVRDLQSGNIVSIIAGSAKGTSLSEQLARSRVAVGLENYIIPVGSDYLSAIYAVNWAIRAPLTFGGLKSGAWREILAYERKNVPALVVLLGHVDEVIVATGLGALAMGFPIVSDLDLPQVGKIDTTLYEAIVTEKDYTKLAARCVEVRGLKVKIVAVSVPVPYAPAFEGERVRKEQLHVEFGGKHGRAFEHLTLSEMKDIEDGTVTLVGPDIDALAGGQLSMPLAIEVEVAGRKMIKDFESILERQLHRFVNYAMGLMHVGQRDMVWIRISRDAFSRGFRLRHIGVALHAMLHQEYSAIVDKVQVSIYTRAEDVARLLPAARRSFEERDERLRGMTDESVDTFYSCTLCQSFAPDHVCMISPERLGLCGAYSWLDGRAAYEITPTGGNQPVAKGNLLREKEGCWSGINANVASLSHGKVAAISMYSLMTDPMTSCGCFECVVAILPEANGVIIVNREYTGMTPAGMDFITLASAVGGGTQTPGFLGIGRLYITSKKFIAAEGGLRRVVWMPKELKESISQRLHDRSVEIGDPDFASKIADETVAVDAAEVVCFLKKAGHPALGMEPLL